jgi:hypothetical protein
MRCHNSGAGQAKRRYGAGEPVELGHDEGVVSADRGQGLIEAETVAVTGCLGQPSPRRRRRLLGAVGGGAASPSLRSVQPQVADRVRAEVDLLPAAVTMPGGQLGN